jgi:hypothetical protein
MCHSICSARASRVFVDYRQVNGELHSIKPIRIRADPWKYKFIDYRQVNGELHSIKRFRILADPWKYKSLYHKSAQEAGTLDNPTSNYVLYQWFSRCRPPRRTPTSVSIKNVFRKRFCSCNGCWYSSWYLCFEAFFKYKSNQYHVPQDRSW